MNDPASESDRLDERLRAGDKSALTELFQLHRERLRRMVELRIDARLRGRVDASNLLQDTFLDAETGHFLGPVLTVDSPITCVAFRGDGGLVVAGCQDSSVHLADPAASRPVGPPRWLPGAVAAVGFTADGRSFVAAAVAGESGTWPVPQPMEAARGLDELTARVEARAGFRMGPRLALESLNAAA